MTQEPMHLVLAEHVSAVPAEAATARASRRASTHQPIRHLGLAGRARPTGFRVSAALPGMTVTAVLDPPPSLRCDEENRTVGCGAAEVAADLLLLPAAASAPAGAVARRAAALEVVTLVAQDGALLPVAWVAPQEPAAMRRRWAAAPVSDGAGDDLPRWDKLSAAAGFAAEAAVDADEAEPDDSATIFLATPPVQRVVFAEEVPSKARPRLTVAAWVFDLAERPMPDRVRWPAAPAPVTARRIERLDGIVRLTNYPLQETEEWQEREQARRARQKPPRSGTRKVKQAIRHWGVFSGEDA